MTEQSTIDILNERSGEQIELVEDSMCSYDAESENYLVEIKNRRRYYSTKLIEATKLFSNFQKSQIKNKDFLYVVTDERGVYVFNITKHIKEIVDNHMTSRLHPINTDFGNSRKITKFCYELPERMSTFICTHSNQ